MHILNSVDVQCEILYEWENGTQIQADFFRTLHAEQKSAFDTLNKSDLEIFSTGTSFGKTVVSAALVAEKKTSTLILVTSNTLPEQWKNRL